MLVWSCLIVIALSYRTMIVCFVLSFSVIIIWEFDSIHLMWSSLSGTCSETMVFFSGTPISSATKSLSLTSILLIVMRQKTSIQNLKSNKYSVLIERFWSMSRKLATRKSYGFWLPLWYLQILLITVRLDLHFLINVYLTFYFVTFWVRIHSCEVYSIRHCVIKFVSDLRQIDGFLRVLRFSLPVTLTATIWMKYC
jgi:hypothetical protein